MPKDEAQLPKRPTNDNGVLPPPSPTLASSSSMAVDQLDRFKTAPLVIAAREKALGVAHSARDWLAPTFTNWSLPLAHLESLATVMFTPLAAHPVCRSESMVKAIQLAQQQQRQRTSSSALASSSDEIVLHSTQHTWPSSAMLLQADIPESSPATSLLQGFVDAYPHFATAASSPSSSASSSPKRTRRRKKRGSASDLESQPLSKSIAERDEARMKKASTIKQIEQITVELETLQAKLKRLQTKDKQLDKKIEALEERILDAELDDQSVDNLDGDEEEPEREGVDGDESKDMEGDQTSGGCFMTLEGHKDDILCVDFDPGHVLVSSSFDGRVSVWDLKQRGSWLADLSGHSSFVRCLQLDKTRLLTGSDDKTLKLWDLASFFAPDMTADAQPSLNEYCIGTFEGHEGHVTTLHCDHTQLISGSNDRTLRQWDMETQQEIKTMNPWWDKHETRINSTFFESSASAIGAVYFKGPALTCGTSDGEISMWDVRTGTCQRKLHYHSGAVECLKFDENHLVSGSRDKTIRILDLRTGEVCETLEFAGPVHSLEFDTTMVISASESQSIHMYNRQSFQHSQLEGHGKDVSIVRVHKNVLASGARDRTVKLWTL